MSTDSDRGGIDRTDADSGIDVYGGGAARAVVGQGVLDLCCLTSPDELSAIASIERVGTVVVPESLAGAYARIPATGVGSTVFVPDGAEVRVHTGSLIAPGNGLGRPEEVLIVVGVLAIVSPVVDPLPYRISVIGSVLAPEGSGAALGPLLSGGVGTVSYYPFAEGRNVRALTGQVRLSGSGLANQGGDPGDVLIAAGQLVVTGPVAEVGYGTIVVTGQLVAPESARAVLEPRLHLQGQVSWVRSERVRVIVSDLEVGPDFFRLLAEPVSLVVLGDLTVTAGVTEEVLLAKLTDIVLLGDVVAPAEVVPVLQVLAEDSLGAIRVGDGSGG